MRLIARTFQDLSVVLGVDAALKICSVFGGSEIRISRRDSPDMMSIRELVGEEILGKLIAYAAGDRLYIPMQSSRLRHERNRRIAELKSQGLSAAEICRTFTFSYRLSERHVYAILAEHEHEQRCRELGGLQLVFEEVAL